MKKYCVLVGLLGALGFVAIASADHGGTHTKYTFADEKGLPCTVAFDDGTSMKGKLFVMGNTQGELMAELSGQTAMANVDLTQVTEMTRRLADGERHKFDLTFKSGNKVVLTAFGGNVVYLKAEGITIVEIVFRKVNSIKFGG